MIDTVKVQDEEVLKESINNKEITNNSRENEETVDDNASLIKLVTEKQKEISNLLTPLTSSMEDPEMSKMLQESLNQFVISEMSQESESKQKIIEENIDKNVMESCESIEKESKEVLADDSSMVVDLTIGEYSYECFVRKRTLLVRDTSSKLR